MDLVQDGLRVRFEYRDDDGTGIVGVEVRSSGFAGESGAWFTDNDLLGFAEQLHVYPLADQQVRLSSGYETDDGIDEHVGLTVRAAGRRGAIAVTAHLATPADQVDHDYPAGSVRVEVLTSYEALGRFAAEIRNLVAGTLKEARLDADVVGG